MALLAACVGLLLLASGGAQAASRQQTGHPSIRGVWKCSADTPSRRARLWWNEVRGSEHTIPDVIEKPSTASVGAYTPPRTDGRCATRPEIARYLAGRIDGLLRRDRALGLPAAASDRGMPADFGDPSRPASGVADGGSSAIDVYLDAGSFPDPNGGGGGITNCTHWFPHGQGNARVAAYVTLFGLRPTSQLELDRIVFDASHELVHVSQCAVANRSGSVNGTTLDLPMVEGSADAFALASSGLIDERNLILAQRQLKPVLAASSSRADDLRNYAQFPFWYFLFGAPSAKRYTSYLSKAVVASTAEHRRGDIDLVYRTFGETAVQQALLRFASFAVLGGDLGRAHFDARRLASGDPDTLAKVSLSTAAPAHPRVRLQRGSYGYLVVPWPDGVTDITVTAGAPAARVAESVAGGTREHGPVSQTGGAWHVHRECDAAGRCSGDANAYVAIANGRHAPLALSLIITPG